MNFDSRLFPILPSETGGDGLMASPQAAITTSISPAMQPMSKVPRESCVDHKNIVKVPAVDVLPAVSVANTSMTFSPKPVP
jgi:hypothetical protein